MVSAADKPSDVILLWKKHYIIVDKQLKWTGR
jgi:hypothetical protein